MLTKSTLRNGNDLNFSSSRKACGSATSQRLTQEKDVLLGALTWLSLDLISKPVIAEVEVSLRWTQKEPKRAYAEEILVKHKENVSMELQQLLVLPTEMDPDVKQKESCPIIEHIREDIKKNGDNKGEKRKGLHNAVQKKKRDRWTLKVNEAIARKRYDLLSSILRKGKNNTSTSGGEEFTRYLTELYDDELLDNFIPIASNPSSQPGCILLSEGECCIIVEGLPSKKSPGPDGVKNETLRSLIKTGTGRTLIHKWLEETLNGKDLPDRIARAVAVPKGNSNELKDSRIIMIQNALPKLLERTILYIMERDCPGMLQHHSDQAGFVKGKSTTRQLLRLRLNVDQAKRRREPFFAALLDIRKAFDTIPVKWLLEQARKRAVELGSPIANSVITLLENWYSTPMKIKDPNNDLSVRVVKGVPQGGVLSPWLFNIGVDLLLQSLEEIHEESGTQTLAFADDLCLLGSKPESLQKLLNRCEAWISGWGGRFAPNKCEVINFVGVKNPQLEIHGQIIKGTNEEGAKYLGRVINRRGLATPRDAFDDSPLISLFKPRKGLTTDLLCIAEEALNWSTILYGCEVFPMNLEELSVYQRHSLVRVMKANEQTRTCICLIN
eukprot:GHVP01017700.1.p1 GENE.GHVP01017700.1~~GHVP01017700.1.p1  ORF type:complete len:611 (-),score=96.34 GHVP01017700.1:1993-3825(-)